MTVEGKLSRALDFLFRTLALFLALELIFYPLRPYIVSSVRSALYAFLPRTFEVVWECTGLDEVFLLASAIWWSVKERKRRVKKIIVGAAILEAYNLGRIVFLAYNPNPFLHEILFRWGGFLVVLAAYYFLMDKEYKQEKGN